jgi:putative ABC transport system permease protein
VDRQPTVDGQPVVSTSVSPVVVSVSIGAHYFETLGLPLLRGRAFTSADGTDGHEAVIVNEGVATLYFPNEDPIGRRVRLTAPGAAGSTSPLVTIVGVLKTLGQQVPGDRPRLLVYVPYRYEPRSSIVIIVRDPSDIATVVSRLREEVRAVDPDIPLFDIQTMNEWMAFLRWPQRVFGVMFSLFACIALAMSAVGIHAVTSQSIAQRTQEIGIRVALGAEVDQVWWLVLKRSLLQLGIGLALGLAGALAVGQLLQGLFVGTSPRDPITLSSITLLLVAVSLAACYWPTRRASRLDPIVALRYE